MNGTVVIVAEIRRLTERIQRKRDTLLERPSAGNDRQMLDEFFEDIDQRGQLLAEAKQRDQKLYESLAQEVRNG